MSGKVESARDLAILPILGDLRVGSIDFTQALTEINQAIEFHAAGAAPASRADMYPTCSVCQKPVYAAAIVSHPECTASLTLREAAIRLLTQLDAWLLSVDAERGLTNELMAICRRVDELRGALTRPPLQTPEQAERERQSHNLGINLG